MDTVESPDLEVEIFNQTLKNPFLLGSGTLIERCEDVWPFLQAGMGGVIPRTTRKIMMRKTHPVPHLYQAGSRKYPVMLNAEWTGADITYWQPYLERLACSRQVAMSVSGRDINDCIAVCRQLDRLGGWLFLEINLSCAHSNAVHGMITRDAKHIQTLIKTLKDAGITTPIAIKLGYSEKLLDLCHVAKIAGADAIVAINTLGPVFDFYIDAQGRPRPALGIAKSKGGLSGASIFHIALTAIADIRSQVEITVIGCGGVVCAEDAIKMMMAGASLVEFYSIAHVQGSNAPKFCKTFMDHVVSYMKKHNIKSLSKIIGQALPLFDSKTKMSVVVPKVNEKTCIGCDLCVPICLPKAINMTPCDHNKANHIVSIDADKCIGCGHCLHVCPTLPNSLSMD